MPKSILRAVFAGPFKLMVDVVNVTRGAGGDYALFVDDDGSGYVVYSADYVMTLELLTPDFLHSTGITANVNANGSSWFPEYFVEAPSLFKRNGIIYAVFGHCCCFCERTFSFLCVFRCFALLALLSRGPSVLCACSHAWVFVFVLAEGSGLFVFTAPHPLGPYTQQAGGNIACAPASAALWPLTLLPGALPTPGQGCQYANPSYTSVTRSQQNFIVQVPTSNGTLYVYTGDRWQQSPDGLKGHDPQFWAPLSFDAGGNILQLQWVDNFTMSVLV